MRTTILRISFLLTLYIFCVQVFSQKITDNKQYGLTYQIYSLDSAQARVLYQQRKVTDTLDLFTRLYSTKYSDSVFDRYQLPKGHYLLVRAKGTNIEYESFESEYFDVRTYGYNGEAWLILADYQGTILEDAEVTIKGETFHFQEDCNCYPIPKVKGNGWAKITHKEHFTYVTIDGYKAPNEKYKNSKTKYKNSVFSSVRILPGYVAFNQPKYHPEDTVKMKAFLVKENGKPWKKNVRIKIWDPSDGNQLALDEKLSPVTEGAFVYEFAIPDTFDIDQSYQVDFWSKRKKLLKRAEFRIEDYELGNTTFTASLEKKEYFLGESPTLLLSGTDANGLPLLDAFAKIKVTHSEMQHHYPDTLFIPNSWTQSFFEKEILLDVSGPTRFEIPDTLFPPTKSNYYVNVVLNNTDNKPQYFDFYFTYNAITERYTLEVIGDSIKANYLYQSLPYPDCKVTLQCYNESELIEEKQVELPYAEKLNYASTTYFLKDEQGTTQANVLTPYRLQSLVYPEGKRTHDSIYISFHNELGIPLSWQIFKNSEKIEGGKSPNLDFKAADGTLDSYYIMYTFRWRNKDIVQEKGFHIKEKQLNVDVDQPETVFPGAQVPITVSVTDYKQEARKDVNLTAWSVNMKFGNIPSPDLPYFGLNHFDLIRPFNVTYAKQKVVDSKPIEQEDIEQLDLYKTPFYRFIYSKGGVAIEYDSIRTEWSEITPFVYTHGTLQKVLTVYIDDEPVYLDDKTLKTPLSVKKKSGTYTLKLRTEKEMYTVKDVTLKPSLKAFVCLNTDSALVNTKVEYLQIDSVPYTKVEEEYLKSSLLVANFQIYGDIYLEQDSTVIYFNGNGSGRYSDGEFGWYNYFGPFKKGQINVTDIRNDTAYSFYFEPGYLYTFKKDTSFVSQPIVYPNPLENFYHYDRNGNWNFWEKSYLVPKVNLPKADVKEEVRKSIETEKNRKAQMHPLLKTRYPLLKGQKEACGVQLANNTGKQTIWMGLFNLQNDSATYIHFGQSHSISDLYAGNYDIFMLFKDSTYLLLPNFKIHEKGMNYFRFDPSYLKKPNQEILTKYENKVIEINKPPVRKFTNPPVEITGISTKILPSEKGITMLSGYLHNYHGEPIDYCTIYAEIAGYFKGGAITNPEGYFEIKDLPAGKYMLKLMLSGKGNYTIYNINVPNGKNTQVWIEPEILFGYEEYSSLSANYNEVELYDMTVNASSSYYSSASLESVVLTKNAASFTWTSGGEINKLRDFEGMTDSLSSLQEIPGVAISTEREQILKLGKEGIDLLIADPNSNKIRTTFRDYGFWKPNLVTDKNGQAHFTVQYPDNITQWKTIVPAMDGYKNSGIGYAYTKSYKPLSANLGIPNFLVETDTAYLVGKILNYTETPIKIKTYFDVDGIRKYSGDITTDKYNVEKYALSSDSAKMMSITYGLDKGDGYIDGEERKLEVLTAGVEKTKATLTSMNEDTSFTWMPNPEMSGRTIYITNDPFDLIKREMEELKNYKYNCNEQTASKLKALLLEKKLLTNLNEAFKDEKDIAKCIKLLEKNQNDDGSWGWWDQSAGDDWVTGYITEAMNLAVASGYRTKAHMKGAAYLKGQLYRLGISDRLMVLNVMASIPYPYDYGKQLKEISKMNLSLQDEFQYLKLLQSQDSTISLDTLLNTYETGKEGIYWGEQLFNVKVNTLQTSLLAYEILKKAGGHDALLKETRSYFLNYKPNTRNTIEQAGMLQQFLEDMLKESTLQAALKPEILINGSNAGSAYPMEFTFKPEDTVRFSKKGAPIKFYSYEHSVELAPVCSDSVFEIKTKFIQEGKEVTQLTSGIPVTMVIDVAVKKSSQYVLMEIPIPASCSYGGGLPQKNSYEEHRKQYTEMTTIACRSLPAGRHQFTIQLIPRFEGSFTVRPASIELMYYPDVNHYTPAKKVIVLPQ